MKEKLAGAGFQFSSANSINIGRLVPQIAYYVYAYLRLMEAGEIQENEQINVVVPTGNFGNILAAYYAKEWEFLLPVLSVLPMKIKCCMTFLEQDVMTETVISV